MTLPAIGLSRPWADAAINAIGRLDMHVPLTGFDRVDLDGEWGLELFHHPDEVPEQAITDDRSLRAGSLVVSVPGNWTLQNPDPTVDARPIDLPHYTNVVMPFDGPPPRLPERNTTGVYRRTFDLPADWQSNQLVVHVAGAESVHAVYVNHTFVGYGTDSRLPSEYDISAVAQPGVNEIAIVVVRYSAHSYIEDQDQWWMAGLHRSVWIEARPQVHIADLVVNADFDPATGMGRIDASATASFTTTVQPGYAVRWSLYTPDGHTICDSGAEVPINHGDRDFAGFEVATGWDIPNALAWSAEQPHRYRIEAQLISPDATTIQVESSLVGCRRVEVANRQLLVNGQPIWIFGVNRHDHHPDRGKAVTIDDMRADLVAMRAHNITAIRTAHYPNDTAFYDLCDELGMYVIDEANIESHGNYTTVSNDPAFRSAFVERGARMVQRDRNHPSVIAWSLGNESGYGPHHDALAAWIRRAEPSRPLHYEGAVAVAGWSDGGVGVTDLVCPMYPEIAEIEAYGRDGAGERPLIMCEYSHAMGNSNGSLADYWEVITSTPGLQGGFIWEWKDHGLRHTGVDGSQRLLFGGQFGDDPHDGNFVADGLMSADLLPHPAMAEVAWVYRPVVTTWADGRPTAGAEVGALHIENRRSFVGLDDLIADCELIVDGDVTANATLAVGPVAPRCSVTVTLPDSIIDAIRALDRSGYVTLHWRTRDDTWYGPRGHVVAWDQLEIKAPTPAPFPPPLYPATTIREQPATPLGVRLELWRAPIDNDGFKLLPGFGERTGVGGEAMDRWAEQGLDRLDPNGLVRHRMSIRGIEHTDGTVRVEYDHEVTVPADLADLPRVGVGFVLPTSFSMVDYVGLGPGENYPDRASGARFGRWVAEVEGCPYLISQSHGLRTDCQQMTLREHASGAHVVIEALHYSGPGRAGTALHMKAVTHSEAELYAAATTYDLPPSTGCHVSIDVAHRGVGTASCGPDVLPEYRIGPGTYRFRYAITTPPHLLG